MMKAEMRTRTQHLALTQKTRENKTHQAVKRETILKKVKTWLLGQPKDPLSPQARRTIGLTVLLAWVGLGADGLSSACYGPEQAFTALGQYGALSLWLALLTAITVFIIAFSYNCVISLFPEGGGGYKVATRLLGNNLGLIAGVALILDYLLTIVISIVSGTNALFSLLPAHFLGFRLPVETIMILLFTFINMRGAKESIKLLLPIFIGFVAIHVGLILYGIAAHHSDFAQVASTTHRESINIFHHYGIILALAIFLHAYAQGGGTYTGLEAVSNNVSILSKPRVQTGKWTMFLMAVSLSFMAGGIILLYLLWNASPVHGKTLNAIVFANILGHGFIGHSILIITLLFEAGLLFVAANTGFLGGPAVLANMAQDKWLPLQFANLSTRLVKQNGVLLFGLGSIVLLFLTDGHIKILVVLYSISVFLAFTTALAGLTKYYWRHKYLLSNQLKLLLVSVGTFICGMIFIISIFTNFLHVAWYSILIFGLIIYFCHSIKKSHKKIDRHLNKLDKQLCKPLKSKLPLSPINIDKDKLTAVIFLDHRAPAMHTLLAIIRLFQHHYKNFIFVGVGNIDSFSIAGENKFHKLEHRINLDLEYMEQYCLSHKLPVATRSVMGVDPIEIMTEVAVDIKKEYPHVVFFGSQLVFPDSDSLLKLLSNKTILLLQQKLYKLGFYMMTLPVSI